MSPSSSVNEDDHHNQRNNKSNNNNNNNNTNNNNNCDENEERKRSPSPTHSHQSHQFYETADEDEKDTCDALCSLMGATHEASYAAHSDCSSHDLIKHRRGSKTCPKQLQLPMFLSKTYHMINTCDQTIATWSETGDNFVVKNVDQFASSVLPRYFKHSNFSSFARQLNFYGFRKLRTDPILTSDVDPQTSCHVRFYHDKFQRDKPDLLHDIKRATKTDQQSKDDVDSLKSEVARLKDALAFQEHEFDHRLAELSYDFNRRISATNAEFDKLTGMVQQFMAKIDQSTAAASALDVSAAAAAPHALAPGSASSRQVPDLLHSLSQIAAVGLQNQTLQNQAAAIAALKQSPPRQPSPPFSNFNNNNIGTAMKRESGDSSGDSRGSPRRRYS